MDTNEEVVNEPATNTTVVVNEAVPDNYTSEWVGWAVFGFVAAVIFIVVTRKR